MVLVTKISYKLRTVSKLKMSHWKAKYACFFKELKHALLGKNEHSLKNSNLIFKQELSK